MLIVCTRCAVRNLPQSLECAFCGTELQTEAQAERQSRGWEKLEEALRRHLSEAHRESLAIRERWFLSLRERRWLHTAIGSILLGLPLGIVYTCWWQGPLWGLAILCPFFFAAGALAGHQISSRGGGQGRGAFLFGSSYLASFLVSMALRQLVFEVGDPYLLRAFVVGSGISLLLGAAFGRYLSFDRWQET